MKVGNINNGFAMQSFGGGKKIKAKQIKKAKTNVKILPRVTNLRSSKVGQPNSQLLRAQFVTQNRINMPQQVVQQQAIQQRQNNQVQQGQQSQQVMPQQTRQITSQNILSQGSDFSSNDFEFPQGNEKKIQEQKEIIQEQIFENRGQHLQKCNFYKDAINQNKAKCEKVSTFLRKFVKLLEEADGLVQDEYTEASWAVLEVRVEDVKKLVDADKTKITQDEVDEAVSNLNQAMALLEKKDDGGDDNDNNIFKNGIYEGIALCKPDEDEDFEAYNLSLKVTIRDDKIVAVTDVTGDGDSSNDKYINKAANGTSSKKGVASQLIGKSDTEGIDVISGATCSSKAILEACDNALVAAKNSKAESGE